MYGHDVVAISNGSSSFTCHVFNCDEGQSSLKSFDVPKEPSATVTSVYNFKQENSSYFVVLLSHPTSDTIAIYQLSHSNKDENQACQVKQLHLFETHAKVQRLALGSGLHHSGYFNDSCASENAAYTNTVQQIGTMNFMAFYNDEIQASSQKATFILQLTDKSLRRLSVNLADASDKVEDTEMFDLAFLCTRLQAALVSDKEVVVGLTQQHLAVAPAARLGAL